MLETLSGQTLTLSTGRVIPTRWVGEQHVQQDLGLHPLLRRLDACDPSAAMDGARRPPRRPACGRSDGAESERGAGNGVDSAGKERARSGSSHPPLSETCR